MNTYLIPVKYAVIVFPVLAAIITLPYFLINYHKYGSVSKLRILIVYSFILYLLCAYFLVILPLPSREFVSNLTTPKAQLIPFSFIKDFIYESGFVLNDSSTYIKALKSASFYQPLFNILLTIPFGIYLRYYFNCSLPKTIIFSFFLSLFFEITQFTGLYFIYPRGYRLFDVDDLLFNTLGGLIGYIIIKPFMKILPSRKMIDEKSLSEGKKVSTTRRLSSFIVDMIIICIVEIILSLFSSIFNFFEFKYLNLYIIFIFLVLIPTFNKGKTIGKLFTNLQITDLNGNPAKIYQIFIRTSLEFILLFVVPKLSSKSFIINIFYFICIIIFIIDILKKKPLVYEKISKTKNNSTIK